MSAIDDILFQPPVSESGRHRDGCRRLLQLRANGMDKQQACTELYRLYPVGSGRNRKIRRGEWEEAWDGLDGKPLTPTRGNGQRKYNRIQQPVPQPTMDPYTHDGAREELPPEEIAKPFSEFLRDVLGFRENEFVWLASKEPIDEDDPTKGEKFVQARTALRVSQLTDPVHEGGCYPSRDDLLCLQGYGELGSFYAINPLRTGDSRKTENVSRFMYTLLEHDSLEKEECLAIYKRLNLPIAALVDTGSRSLHAIVKVDAPNKQEFDRRVDFLHSLLDGIGFDNTKDAVRFSRIPGCPYGYDGDMAHQRLLATNIGAESWEAWERSFDGLPEIESLSDLEGEDIPEPPELIEGILHQGSKMVIGSNSKGRKTMLLIDLATAIATGTEWLGFETKKGRVLYINLELQKFFFRKRCRQIAEAKGLKIEQLSDNFDSMTLRGYCGDASELIPAIANKIGSRVYDVIIIDPTYKLMGGKRDENKTTDIATLLNEFEKLAVETGAAVVFVSHFSKGNQSGKEAIDRISGSGVFARDPDTIMTLTAHEEPDAMTVETTLRNFPPIEPFTIKWNGNWLFERVSLDPKRMKKAGAQKQYSASQLLDALGDESMSDSEWKNECAERFGISKAAFYRLKGELVADHRVYRSKLDNKWTKTVKEAEKSRSNSDG
jgi:RecA-family ATPase